MSNRRRLAGLLTASAAVIESLRPGILPRSRVDQGVLSGVSAVIGWIIGRSIERFAGPIAVPIASALLGRSGGLTAGPRNAIAEVERKRSDTEPDPPDLTATTTTALGVVTASVLVGSGLSKAGHWIARSIGGPPRFWKAVVASTGITMLGVAGATAARTILRDVSQPDLAPDTKKRKQPSSPTRSGSPQSLVRWAGLGRLGRQFVACGPDAAGIDHALGESAREPIRVYVGTDGVPARQVELALAELERAGGLERSHLLIATPVSTGYVNPVPIEAFEFLTRGDCATVAIKYGDRPSMFAADRIKKGVDLYATLMARLGSQAQRTRLLAFGESLGALVSRIAVARSDNRLAGALWIGSPNSRSLPAPHGLIRAPRPMAIPEPGPRFVTLDHESDPVPKLSRRLILSKPDWLSDGTRSPAVHERQRWTPIITYLQTMIDAKNAAIVEPGKFTDRAHDYRLDTAQAIKRAFGLNVSDEQMTAIESSLRRLDSSR